MSAQTAEGLAAQLGGTKSERAAALSALEATSDAALGARCVAALAAVQAQPAAAVDAAEYRAASLVLARLATLDPVRIGGEFFKEMRFLSPQPRRTRARWRRGTPTLRRSWRRGGDVIFGAAGISAAEMMGATLTADNATNAMKQDDAKAMRMVTLTLDMLREDRGKITEAEVTGAWQSFSVLIQAHSAVDLDAVQGGAVGMAIVELRTGSPADWVSVSGNPIGKHAAALGAICNLAQALTAEHRHLMAATPRLLDVFLDCLKAYETSKKGSFGRELAGCLRQHCCAVRTLSGFFRLW